MEKRQKIESFKTIGMIDPTIGSADHCLIWLRSLHHDEKIYPAEMYDPEDERPPNCIFVPSTNILNLMIETCANHPENIEYIFSRFSCLD